MSSPSALQCLFCNHINPGGATFCNDCGSQLQLQQCDLCGSINKRSARICYKCGAPLGAPAAHGGHAVIDGDPAGAVPGQVAGQHEASTLPESAALALGSLRRGSPDAAPAVPGDDDRGKVAAATAGFRHLYSIAWSVLAVALVFLSLYYYRARSSPDLSETDVERAAPAAPSGDQASAGPASAVPLPPRAGALSESRSSRASAFRVLGATETVSPPGAAPTGSTAAVGDLPAHESCPEAVVALGLCDASGKQEKP